MAYESSVWQSKLDELAASGLIRNKPRLSSPQGPLVEISGSEVINFASNDYLGLASSPNVSRASAASLTNFGFGSGASALVCGYNEEHALLESELAVFTGRDKALLFSTGYMANLAVSASLCGSKSLIMQDKLNHASLIDGAKLSGARSQRYLHNTPESLENYLQKFVARDDYDQVLVSTDGVFSMDGDVAKVSELADVCDRYKALLVVDDAHGLGVLGPSGKGTLEAQSVDQYRCPLLIGTFGKAFGGFGAFVAGPNDLMNYLEQVARPHIYTTAIPASVAAAARAGLQEIKSADVQRAHLGDLISTFRNELNGKGFELLDSSTPIQGVVVGGNQQVLELSEFLRRNGILVGAIRPPTVPKGSARLRITLSAAHTFDHLETLIDALSSAKQKGLC